MERSGTPGPAQKSERAPAGRILVPGLVAQVNSGVHQQCQASVYRYFSGPPNFIFDAYRAEQQPGIDRRRALFETFGVLECVLWNTTAQAPVWLRRDQGRLIEVPLTRGEIIESTALPGLHFPVDAFLARDWRTVMAAISHGITRPAHRDFMATIWKK